MASQRIKGQEVSVFLTQNGVTQSQLDSIQDLEITIKLEKKEEGYLGETTNRYDDVFTGIDGTFTVHLTQQTVYAVVQAIIDRARRRTPGTQFNLKATLAFPNGDRRRIIVDNLFFGNIPNAFPKRDEYASMKFDFSAASGRFI